MSAILFRIVLLASGLGLSQMGLDSLAHGADVALIQLGMALILLIAGSAGFIVPLLEGDGGKEVSTND